jgi:hypothetical protein
MCIRSPSNGILCLLFAILFGLSFDLEDVGYTLLRKACRLSTDYMAINLIG